MRLNAGCLTYILRDLPDGSQQKIKVEVCWCPPEPDVGIFSRYAEVDCLEPGVELTYEEEEQAVEQCS